MSQAKLVNNGAYVGSGLYDGRYFQVQFGCRVVAISVYLIWRRARSGWRLPTNVIAGVGQREHTA